MKTESDLSLCLLIILTLVQFLSDDLSDGLQP